MVQYRGRTLKEKQKSLEFIKNLIKELNPDFGVDTWYQPFDYHIGIQADEQRTVILFSMDIISDFEEALEGNRDSPYYYTLEGNIRFRLFVELGKFGILPDFIVSEQIINEKRQWWDSRYSVNLRLEQKMSDFLTEGLEILTNVFDFVLQRSRTRDLPDIRQHKDLVEQIYEFSKEKGNLNDDGVSFGSLQYLKAAGVAKIIQWEHQRDAENITKIAEAINQDIYYVVGELRKDSFLEVKLPDFINTVKEVLYLRRTEGEPDKLNGEKGTVPARQRAVEDSEILESSPRMDERYNVAFSLAHEQHTYVDDVFECLKQLAPDINVFYYRDEGQKVQMWGRNMFEYLQAVYRDQSDHVIIFVSADYVEKRWTLHEWRSVQEAILARPEEYLLPARFDDSQLAGLPSTIHYIDLSQENPEQFAEKIVSKIRSPKATE